MEGLSTEDLTMDINPMNVRKTAMIPRAHQLFLFDVANNLTEWVLRSTQNHRYPQPAKEQMTKGVAIMKYTLTELCFKALTKVDAI